MKKIAAYGLGIVVVAVLIAGAVAYSMLNVLIKDGVETAGPMVAKTSVRLDSANVLPLAGTGSLRGLRIGNPAGFSNDDAFKVSQVSVSVRTRSLLSPVIVVRSVEIAGPEILFEGTPAENNLKRLQANMASVAPPASPTAKATPSGPSKKIIIDDFKLTGAKLHVKVKLLPEATLTLPDIHLTGIGRKGNGVTAQEAAAQIFGALNQSATQAVQGALQDLTKNATELGKKLLGPGAKDLGGVLRGLLKKR
jgi:hypothetical protein